MIETIKMILDEFENISGWKINEEKIDAREYFFIRQEMDMARGKVVKKYKLTVYRDFLDDGKKYRGSSTTSIYPKMNNSEIRKIIKDAVFEAQFARSEYYPLVEPCDRRQPEIKSDFSEKKVSNWGLDLAEVLFKADNYSDGWINSAELFINQTINRIINSVGIDVSYTSYSSYIEVITNWKDLAGEEVELFRRLEFADYSPEKLENELKKMFKLTKEKAEARLLPSLNEIPVLLTGNPARKLLEYYYLQASSKNKYEQIAMAEKGKNIQGNEIIGDKITLHLKPFMKGSTKSAPYDEDGYPLDSVKIYKDGILNKYWGKKRYSYYLNEEPTGYIENKVFAAGSKSVEAMKENPYLELLDFSNFQMDPITGNFGGEIRLGRYYDGEKVISVTGGSISGNILKIHHNMFLSEELQKDNNFIGPNNIELKDISISGR